MLNLDFSDSLTKLNFIGVVSLFGGEIAISALRYTALIRNVLLSAYFTMVLSPGLQTVSLKMFKQMDDRVSRAISGGPRDDRKDIMGLSASGKYKYVGIHSGTKMSVASILGEALIGASKSTNPGDTIDVHCSRNVKQRRDLKLKVIEISMENPMEDEGVNGKSFGPIMRVDNKLFGYRSVLMCMIPLITIAGIVITLLAEDYLVFSLISVNVISNVLVAVTTRSNGIRYPIGKPSEGCPKGDILVETSDGTDMCMVIADEEVIQYLFQKSLIMPPNPESMMWKYGHILAAYLSYIVVVVNIILLPFSTAGGQIIFGALIFFGVVQNILLSTFDGDGMMLEAIQKFFTIQPTKEYVFQTRSTAVAFCLMRSGSEDVKPLRHLLPDTETFDIWFENVLKVANGTPIDTPVDNKLLVNLNMDLQDAFREYKESGNLEVVDEK